LQNALLYGIRVEDTSRYLRFFKLGIDCERLPRAAVPLPCSCPALESGSRARLLIDAAKETLQHHKTVSTERAQNTEIPFPRDKEPLRFGSKRAKFARGNVRSAARNIVSTLRGKARNTASRGSRAQPILGFTVGYARPL
jgi:hypothetical protein